MDIKTINKYIKLNESHSLRVTREAKQLKTQNSIQNKTHKMHTCDVKNTKQNKNLGCFHFY